jgi:hypothetical protein
MHLNIKLLSQEVYYDGENEVASYHRFGDDDGVEPLVILRDFHGVLPSFLELSEEYRHFHNLFFKEAENIFVKIDDDGDEEVVGRLFDRKVELRLREIRQFLAIKEMHLGVFFEITRYSKIEKSIVKSQAAKIEVEEGLIHYLLYVVSDRELLFRNGTSFSRLIGKKLIEPFPKEKSGIYPYNKNDLKEFENFIIGTDENSEPVMHTCNPDELANYFGKNPDAPHYLTPVFFKREALSKYYSNPDKYTVSDGSLACTGLWQIRIDNNHPKHVVLYLGDLGRDLSFSEQKYWKSFNIVPDGKVSEVEFKRGFLAEFADPESPDLLFKLLFEDVNEKWEKHFGWKIFLPLTKEDSHFYTSLRIPANDSQSEFDNQVSALTKVILSTRQ